MNKKTYMAFGKKIYLLGKDKQGQVLRKHLGGLTMNETNRMSVLTWLFGVVGSFATLDYFPYSMLFWIPNIIHWAKIIKKGYEKVGCD